MHPRAQELQFYTKAYTILDGKMMLSEIEGIGFPSPLPGEDVKPLAMRRRRRFRLPGTSMTLREVRVFRALR